MTVIEALDTDGNMAKHAIRELELLGQTQEDPEFARSLVEAVRAFSSYGHSGGSHAVAVSLLNDLLQGHALTPVGPDDEWIDRSEMSGRPMWQSVRDSRVFSDDGGKSQWRAGEKGEMVDPGSANASPAIS